jgi:hypothetical protein
MHITNSRCFSFLIITSFFILLLIFFNLQIENNVAIEILFTPQNQLILFSNKKYEIINKYEYKKTTIIYQSVSYEIILHTIAIHLSNENLIAMEFSSNIMYYCEFDYGTYQALINFGTKSLFVSFF